MGQHAGYDILKDFQPALAALVALIAAVVAWFGATSKTRFDSRQTKLQVELEKVGILIRLRHDLTVVRALFRGMATEKGFDEALASECRTPERQRDIEHVKRMIDDVPEIEAAWKRLEMFPIHFAEKIGEYRRGLLVVSLALDPVAYPVFPSPDMEKDTKFSVMAAHMLESTDSLIRSVDGLIEIRSKIAKDFDDAYVCHRNGALYKRRSP